MADSVGRAERAPRGQVGAAQAEAPERGPDPDSALDLARERLRRTFGHRDFRGLQAQVIGEALAGRSALAVLPTGGGKSLCYQIPALIRPGVAVVVSPLIALMADQVAALRQQGVAAARLDSAIAPEARGATLRQLEAGALDLLYMSPEGLMQPAMLERLSRLPVALVAVDEAHCVSQWGHDFRPEYRALGRLAEVFAGAPRLAVTATADARTRADIRAELRLQDAREFVDSFARPELQLQAERKRGQGASAHARAVDLIRARPGQAGVVYAGSREGTERLAEALRAAGVDALAYHAGLDKDVRQDRLSRFLDDEAVVMVATIAFGMGIDKPDVRFVIHADPPASIEAYWQEVGRAGRDGAPAEGITLYSPADMAWAMRRIDGREVGEAVRQTQARKLRQLYGMLDGVECRAAAVRRYFGEVEVEPCGQCDLCLTRPALRDVTLPAQKLLSAIQRLGGRFGRGRVVDHLLGKARPEGEAEARLSTFGLGRELGASDWRDLLDQLLLSGLAREDPNDGRPLISLGDAEAVRAVYRGDRRVEVRAPDAAAAQARPGPRRRVDVQAAVGVENAPLFEALRGWRREQAARQSVPPYVIFHDRTLAEIARARPATLAALGQVSGVGQGKLDRYGADLLALLRAAARSLEAGIQTG